MDRPRILIVDDSAPTHRDFEEILASGPGAIDCDLHGEAQGDDGVRAVADAIAAGHPYTVAFVDLRMPPGIDGIETVARMWCHQPDLEVVLCCAYDDNNWEELLPALAPRDRMVVLRKPCEPVDVRQLAASLIAKVRHARRLADLACEREAARERARLDAEQRRSQRLEALGRLTAGLAHEINTPTQFATASMEFIAEAVGGLGRALRDQRGWFAQVAAGEMTAQEAHELSQDGAVDYLLEETPRAIGDARHGLDWIARIVHSVRSQAHLRDREGLVPTNVNIQVRAALELARAEYKYDADVVTDLADVPPVPGDPGDLSLAIVNLVINAAQAIREKRAGSGPRGVIAVTTRVNADRAEIAITDTGCGIPVEVRDRIFEPFFTTKPMGQGTGQGLSICRATIVDRHNGTISVESEPGRGATFVIGLPLAAPAQGSPS